MTRFKRYITALRRYNRSRGFGIHSPFAFYFVRRVLRERCHYYAYEQLSQCRTHARHLVESRRATKSIISMSNARMLFRIACYFDPLYILQIGSTYGVSTMSMLAVSTRSGVTIYTGGDTCNEVFNQVTASESGRIDRRDTLAEAITTYRQQCTDKGFALINNVPDSEITSLASFMNEIVEAGGVVVMRNLSRLPQMKRLWNVVTATMSHGMTFSNYRIGIIVGLKHLPRQNFTLWF